MGEFGTAAAVAPRKADSFSFDESTRRHLGGFNGDITSYYRITEVDRDMIRIRDAMACGR
jgi:hypothetical protein